MSSFSQLIGYLLAQAAYREKSGLAYVFSAEWSNVEGAYYVLLNKFMTNSD